MATAFSRQCWRSERRPAVVAVTASDGRATRIDRVVSAADGPTGNLSGPFRFRPVGFSSPVACYLLPDTCYLLPVSSPADTCSVNECGHCIVGKMLTQGHLSSGHQLRHGRWQRGDGDRSPAMFSTFNIMPIGVAWKESASNGPRPPHCCAVSTPYAIELRSM